MATRVTDDERLERYAELAVRVGANVQPGQQVFVHPMVEHADLGRALVRQAYEAGAEYVHVLYRDDHNRHAMIGLGPDSALTYSPEWAKELMLSEAGGLDLYRELMSAALHEEATLKEGDVP